MAQSPRRFIAGVVCPSCAEMDKIVMYSDEGRTMRECVRCGYQDQMQEESNQEIPTRISAKKGQEKPQAEPIKFYPRSKSK